MRGEEGAALPQLLEHWGFRSITGTTKSFPILVLKRPFAEVDFHPKELALH